MKIFVLAPQEGWICDRIAAEWVDHNPELCTSDPAEADILWLLAGWCWNHISQDLLASKKVMLTVHHIVPQKFDLHKQQEFSFRDQFVDVYHVPNAQTAAIVRSLTEKPIFVACYWYDDTIWFDEDHDVTRSQLELPADKFIIGSFQRDTEGDTGAPKLEKGPDLFCDMIELIRENLDVHVLLGGWRRQYVMDRLDKAGVPFSFFEKSSTEKLRTMYNACDLYVVASRHEGGPQAILEAAATRTPIISTCVGIAPVVLHPYCIVDIPNSICIPDKRLVEVNFMNVQRFEIKTHKQNYIKLFERMVS